MNKNLGKILKFLQNIYILIMKKIENFKNKFILMENIF